MATEAPPHRRLATALRLGQTGPEASPSRARIAVATALALAGSLAADAILVSIGEALWPSTRGFSHFRFVDYGTLTLLGVLAACAAWPVVVRLSFAPRWLFARLAVLAMLALWLPDLWILVVRHEQPRAVLVLALMHVGVALVTYSSLVHVAPAAAAGQPAPSAPAQALGGAAARRRPNLPAELATRRSTWAVMASLVGLELVLGMLALVLVPFGRPSALVPRHGQITYLAHGALGALLAVGSVWLVVSTRAAGRVLRLAAVVGLAGLVLGAAGGALATEHPLRLLGAGLMMLGGGVAGCGYLIPAVEPGDAIEPGAVEAGGSGEPGQPRRAVEAGGSAQPGRAVEAGEAGQPA